MWIKFPTIKSNDIKSSYLNIQEGEFISNYLEQLYLEKIYIKVTCGDDWYTHKYLWYLKSNINGCLFLLFNGNKKKWKKIREKMSRI